MAEDIPIKNNGQIKAAPKIMETCTFYLILKNTIHIKRDILPGIWISISVNIFPENLSVKTITEYLGIQQDQAFMKCAAYITDAESRSISVHCVSRRLKAPPRYRIYPVTQISDMVGFSDYNYFCRSFKNMPESRKEIQRRT